MATQRLVEELRQVLAEDYDRKVSVDEASQILSDLAAYFDLLARMHHQTKEPATLGGEAAGL